MKLLTWTIKIFTAQIELPSTVIAIPKAMSEVPRHVDFLLHDSVECIARAIVRELGGHDNVRPNISA
ncbi:hypothetical protein CD32_17570 [Lysinibacillus odysseyi 34hs-1 = NBRC 100172]|uniref:Uncharacterized protein n=1 Tax=Lysinibacillus odysseyi 34hs-1 = NBRC 100172 TaxID=1220589 RepID=A0A0A3J6G4_9BACI|nr:hypothetical protein CD32_17570 [Lysinibacillus odysseyi 34hs-1 = NBRC 100172]